MAKTRKPKALKMPKRPRRSASTATLAAYVKRCEEVRRENARRQAAHKRDTSQRAALVRKIWG